MKTRSKNFMAGQADNNVWVKININPNINR